MRDEGFVDILESRRGSPILRSEEGERQNMLYYWRGRYSHVPEDFTFPKGSTLIAWQIWCCGDSGRKIIPFSKLNVLDMPSKDTRKRLSDMKFLCNFIQKMCIRRNVWRFSSFELSADETVEMFYHAEPYLPFGGKTSTKGVKRRPRQVSWRTMVKYMRQTGST